MSGNAERCPLDLTVGNAALRLHQSSLAFSQSVQIIDVLVHLSIGCLDLDIQVDNVGVEIDDLLAQRLALGRSQAL